MAFDTGGIFTGTSSSLAAAGLGSVTGTTTVVIGNVTHYFTNRRLYINGTLTYDATKETMGLNTGTSKSLTEGLV